MSIKKKIEAKPAESAEEFIKNLPVNHIGLVVRDIDKTMEALSAALGIGPWLVDIPVKHEQNQMLTGKAHVNKVAQAKLDKIGMKGMVIILAQPTTKGNLYDEFLKTKGEGIHHIGIGVKNWDEVVAKVESLGYKKLIGAKTNSKYTGSWCYFNIGGLIIEIKTDNKPDYIGIGGKLKQF